MKRLTFSVFAALALLSVSALAQTNVASITGIVIDASGAVVPKAEVIITNIETGIARRMQTNDAACISSRRSIPAVTASRRIR